MQTNDSDQSQTIIIINIHCARMHNDICIHTIIIMHTNLGTCTIFNILHCTLYYTDYKQVHTSCK